MKITYHDFGFFAPITLIAGCIMLIYIYRYAQKEYRRKRQMTLMDIFGLTSWCILSFCPILGFCICVVASINLGIDKLMNLFASLEDIVIFRKK